MTTFKIGSKAETDCQAYWNDEFRRLDSIARAIMRQDKILKCNDELIREQHALMIKQGVNYEAINKRD